MPTATLINKEEIVNYRFAHEEVLAKPEEIKLRKSELDRAIRIGNAHHGKIGLVFKAGDGTLKKVETTVWDSSDKYIILKGGISIPVHCITEVIIY